MFNWNDQPSTIRFQNLVVENNNAMYGGGVFVRKANLQMDNCIIRDNHTYNDQFTIEMVWVELCL